MKTMEEILSPIRALPTLPDIVLRVMRLSNDPETPIDSIVDVLKLDQGVTANVLRLCNSPFYAKSRKVESIHDAVVYLGAKAIVDFLMAGFCSTFFRRPLEGYRLEEGQLWQNSVAVGIASEEIATAASGGNKESQSLAYTAGLLHGIGKIVLNQSCHDDLVKVLRKVEQDRVAFEIAEKEILGISHCEAGAEIARRWRLPPSIVDAIAHYPNPEEAQENPWLVSCVHLGNLLVLSMGMGMDVDGLAAEFHPGAVERIGLDMPAIMRLSVTILERYNAAIDTIQMG